MLLYVGKRIADILPSDNGDGQIAKRRSSEVTIDIVRSVNFRYRDDLKKQSQTSINSSLSSTARTSYATIRGTRRPQMLLGVSGTALVLSRG